MREEYRSIVDAGFLLQVDDPGLLTQYALRPDWSVEDCRAWARIRVEALNHALRGIPPERVRFHTCYSVNVSRRVSAPLSSVANGLRLLLMLRERDSIRVSDASAELNVARSTAHRLLKTLTLYGLLEQDHETRAYGAGPPLAELTAALLRRDDLVKVLHPFLQELSDLVGETTHVIVLEGRICRFVDSVECHKVLRTTARIGIAYPAHATSAGKALLAELDDAELERLFPEPELPPLNERSLTSRDALFAELARVRTDDYAVNRGESELGVVAVAMAQRTSSGEAPAALAISAPEQRFPSTTSRPPCRCLRPWHCWQLISRMNCTLRASSSGGLSSAVPARSPAAPESIHFLMTATSASVGRGLPLGGIFPEAIMSKNGLARDLPGTTAGSPLSPPLRSVAKVRRSRPPFLAPAP